MDGFSAGCSVLFLESLRCVLSTSVRCGRAVAKKLCRSFTDQHLRACIALSGHFAAEFVRIDRHSFIGSLPKANAGRQEAGELP